jgi:hypothetical protein
VSGGLPSLFGGVAAPADAGSGGGSAAAAWSDNFPAEYLAALQSAAQSTAPDGWAPEEWAAVIGGVVSRESAYRGSPNNWGGALKPRGPAGAGDPTSRWAQNPPDWAELSGATRVNASGTVQREYLAPLLPGSDEARGWGAGLCQFDFAVHKDDDWFAAGGWADPATAFQKCGELLAALYSDLGLTAAVAAYNQGAAKTKKLVAAGKDPDSGTTGGDYASDALDRARSLYGLRRAS